MFDLMWMTEIEKFQYHESVPSDVIWKQVHLIRKLL